MKQPKAQELFAILSTTTSYNSLTSFEQDIFKARSLDAPVRDIPEKELKLFLIELIEKMYHLCGVKLEAEPIKVQIPELLKDLKMYFRFLTITEIEMAFKKGCKKDYGEYYGLNYKTYIGWINAYRNEQSRANAINAIDKAKKELEPKPKELSEEEKEAIVKNGVLQKWEDYKSGKPFDDTGNVAYNYLDRKGLIKFTAEKKKAFMELAKKQNKEDAILKKCPTIGSVLEEANIITTAKKIALFEYFGGLVEVGEDLDKLI